MNPAYWNSVRGRRRTCTKIIMHEVQMNDSFMSQQHESFEITHLIWLKIDSWKFTVSTVSTVGFNTLIHIYTTCARYSIYICFYVTLWVWRAEAMIVCVCVHQMLERMNQWKVNSIILHAIKWKALCCFHFYGDRDRNRFKYSVLRIAAK